MTECFRCGATDDLEAFGNGAICPECRPDGDADAVEDAAPDETPDNRPPEADSPGSNPTPDADKPPSGTEFNQHSGDDGGGVLVNDDGAPAARRSGRTFYPEVLREKREWWVDWVLALPLGDDGTPEEDATPTKQPVAPYRRGDATPVRWNFGLDDDDHPSTTFDTVRRWENARIGVDVHAPERVVSDALGVGIIIPPTQDGRTITLLDWDDVRDPDTGEIHPVVAVALDAAGGYAEVSQSGEGIHQFLFGEIPGGLKKFIRHIDDEPFIGDDRPQVEMYQSGRLCAMTGEHVAGTGETVVEGQDLIDRLCWEYGTASNTGPGTPTDPFAGDRDDGDATPSHDTVDAAIREGREYDGPAVEEWDTPADRSLEYDAVLRARERSDELPGVANWELIGHAAGLGYRDGLDEADVLDDLRAHPTPQYGFDDTRARKEVRAVYRKARNGNYHPPTAERLAERGILPEDAVDDTDPVAVLPPAVRDLTTAASGWDWKHAGRTDDTLTVEDARGRTVDAIADAYTSGDRVLVESLPTMGKSYGALKAAADTDQQVTVLTGRGHKEQYEQFRAWADEHDLDHYTLPSFTRDCLTAAGEFGEEWADTVLGWYNRGATPKEIHAQAEYVLDRPLPCQEHEGQRCPYASKWDFDPDEYDVLIGHYAHAHKSKVTTGRTVVADEFPGGAYETVLGDALPRAVSYWLECTDGVPFDSYTDLVENRDDEDRRADALLWFDEHGADPDETHVFDDESAHAVAPLAVFTLLASDDLGNGWEAADLGDGVRGLFTDGRDFADRNPRVVLLRPPALEYASGVVALDGTPTKRMWELALGERLNHRPVLQDEERVEYVRDALNLNLLRTTEYVKPYNSPDHVTPANDAALLEKIAEKHGERPGVITTTTALDEHEDAGVLDLDRDDDGRRTGGVTDGLADRVRWYGNVLGSNEFKEKRVGALLGSTHYGDGYIKKWGAYAGDAVERGGGKGADLSYSGIGDRILTHMREHETVQAAMRFGRDGNGAAVYVHTDTLPDWVPIAGEGRVLDTRSDGERAVIDAVEDLGAGTTAEITAHPAVEIGRRQVFAHLEDLRERGVLDREQDADDGRRVVWVDGGVHRLNDHGEVELGPVEIDDLDDGEVQELARSSIYTWEFRNSPATPVEEDVQRGESPTDAVDDSTSRGGPPPEPGD